MDSFEIKIINFIDQISSSTLEAIFKLITMLGEPYIIIVILCAIYFGYSRKKGELICVALFSTILINNFLKGIISRERPWLNEDFNGNVSESIKKNATGSSFPSGHTQIATTVYSSIAILEKKKWITIVACVLIFLVALSRIILMVHYPTDVLAGVILGLIVSFLVYYFYSKIIDKFKIKIIVIGSILLVFLPLVFIFSDTEKDFFTGYGLFLGYFVSLFIDHFFVGFEDTKVMKTRILRFVVAIVFVLIPYFVLKEVFPENIYFDMLRYFVVALFGFGLYPLIFKKVLFKKEDANS